MTTAAAPLDLLGDGSALRAEVRAMLARWSTAALSARQDALSESAKEVWHALLQAIWPKVATADDLRVVAEEIGAVRCPLPLHSGLAQPAALLAALGEPAASALDELRSAQKRYALALHDEAGTPIVATSPVIAAEDADGVWRLAGCLRHLHFADDAEVLLVPATLSASGESRPVIAAVARLSPGVSVTTSRAMDGAGLSEVRLNEVAVSRRDVFGVDCSAPVGPALARAFALGIIARCGELTGLSAGLLHRTVARVRDRHAFGQPLGALPTVQQRAADMYLDVISARDATSEAAALLDAASHAAWAELDARVRLSLSAAQVAVTQAALRVAGGAHQLCGGWGHLDEAGLHHYTRAIKTAENQLGSVRYHRALIAGELATALG